MSEPLEPVPEPGFYDRVATRFGAYRTGARHTNEFPEGDPEALFRDRLIGLGGSEQRALDVGCADGRFTLSIAPHFGSIQAVDLSSEMLRLARISQKEQGIANVTFIEDDAAALSFRDQEFDVVYSRRGPVEYAEFARVLTPVGHFVGIEIGEQDARGLKEVFGRGQGFGEWNRRQIVAEVAALERTGFDVVLAREIAYTEYYASYDDLDLFLQGVPIFEDYDRGEDATFLEAYVARWQTERGIAMGRHRIVIDAVKR